MSSLFNKFSKIIENGDTLLDKAQEGVQRTGDTLKGE